MGAAEDVASRIRDVIESPRATELVAAYYDPKGAFAGLTFETVGDYDANQFGPSDLLALTLLDVGLPPPGVRKILGDRDELAALLADVPAQVDLWDATESDLRAADRLYAAIRRVPGAGPVITTKLMARKRPRLIPVVDKHVIATLRAPDRQYWRTMRDALVLDDLWATIEATLRGEVPAVVPTLRLLDVAIWMLVSESGNAREVRKSLNLPVTSRI